MLMLPVSEIGRRNATLSGKSPKPLPKNKPGDKVVNGSRPHLPTAGAADVHVDAQGKDYLVRRVDIELELGAEFQVAQASFVVPVTREQVDLILSDFNVEVWG